MGRRPLKNRPQQGAHIHKLRVAAGLTQAELAEMLGETQSNIAFWEMSDKPPRSDVLPQMAAAFGVTLEELLKPQQPVKPRTGPVGKLQRVFDDVARLPRSQQEKVIDVIQTVVRGLQNSP